MTRHNTVNLLRRHFLTKDVGRRGGKEKAREWERNGGDRKTKGGAEWGEMTFHNPLFFPVKHYTQYHHRAAKARAFTSIFKFNTPFNLQGHKSKKKTPPFTRGTYW